MKTKCKTHRNLEVVLLLICLTSFLAKNTWADEDSKYLKAVREFADNVLTGTCAREQAYFFPGVDRLPANEGLPDPLIKPDGSRVESEKEWEKQRAYLKAILSYYQYGHVPPVPKDLLVKQISSQEVYDGKALQSRIDIVISRGGKEVVLRTVILRPNRPGKFPVIVKNDEFLLTAAEIGEPDIRRIYEGRREEIDEFVRHEALKRNYVFCKFIRTDLALDEKNNRHSGVFPLYPEHDWGTIAAWGWGYQIVIDSLRSDAFIDMDKIVATGHARGGKAALCAGVYDERIMITAPHVSGPGGTGSWRFFDLNQYPYGLAAVKENAPYFWVPRVFSFIGREDRLPFDAHFAKALIAPRVFLNTHARHDYATNPYGTYLTHIAAQRVYDLLAVKENLLIHWRDGSDHCQSKEDWLALFDVCDRVFFGKDTNRRFNDNPFPGLYGFDVLLDVNTGGITALHHAVEKGYTVARLLIERGVNVNVKNAAGDTPLHYAAKSRNAGKDMVEVLIANGADVNAKNNDGQTTLDIAVRRNRKDIVQLLLAKGATISSIHVAAQMGDLARVKAFLEEGTDVNAKDGRGYTPFHYAIWYSKTDIAKLLIEKGADIHAKDQSGYTPLHWAVLMGNKELTELVLAKGADVNARGKAGETPLDFAIYYEAIGQLLVQKGAETASIQSAAFIGDLEKVKGFLDKDVNVNEKKPVRVTALHAAAAGGHKNVAEFLISKGADIDIRTNDGQTALHWAASRGHKDVAELFISKGADVHAKDKRGRTPFSLAVQRGHTEIGELLRKHGAKE